MNSKNDDIKCRRRVHSSYIASIQWHIGTFFLFEFIRWKILNLVVEICFHFFYFPFCMLNEHVIQITYQSRITVESLKKRFH